MIESSEKLNFKWVESLQTLIKHIIVKFISAINSAAMFCMYRPHYTRQIKKLIHSNKP